MTKISIMSLEFFLAEVLGAVSLILHRLLHIQPGLTPLATAALVIIMIGATVVTVGTVDIPMALIPLVIGLLAVFVVYGGWRGIAHPQVPLSPNRGTGFS